MRPVGNATGLGLAAAVACVGFACHAEVHPGETQGLGLRGAEVPELLKTVAANPYRSPAAPACETIPAELKALDQVLGADAGEPRKHRSQAAKWVLGSVRGMVPYRGVVRFLTGADKRDHALTDATMAGFARRGFLRGLEANLHCASKATAVSVPNIDPPPPLDAPALNVASAGTVAIAASYAPAEPVPPPAAPQNLVNRSPPNRDLVDRDFASLMLDGASAAPPPEDAAPDPGR